MNHTIRLMVGSPGRATCVVAGFLLVGFGSSARGDDRPAPIAYRIQLAVLHDGYDRKTCWFHPRAGALPGQPPTIVLCMQPWDLRASDLFLPIHSQCTADLGKTWSPLMEHPNTLGRRPQPDHLVIGVCDFTPKWHAKTGTLLGTGHSVTYEGIRLRTDQPRHAVWSVYEPATATWTAWQTLIMPDEAKFFNGGAGSTQRVDLPNGDILLPIYFRSRQAKTYATTVLRCRFDGRRLHHVEHGDEIMTSSGRGFYEPSLAWFGNEFFVTLRTDKFAAVARSRDGLHFSKAKPWTFDDGADLGSYNTQAHWVTHGDGLFLVYTRRGANNDHVVRHRAPLFMAQVDPARLVVLRATERELVPNKGAQLGNFAVVDVNENETWVTTSEGMLPGDPSQYGANGRVYAARICWEKPNRAWNQH